MNKTKILLITTGILIALAIVTGISYAVWLLTDTQTNKNVLASECFDITFTEDTDSNIQLDKSYPLLDSEGENLTPYTFSIENTCDIIAKYNINLEVLNTTTLDHDLIKTMIDTNTPKIITTNNIVTSTIENSTSYNLKTDYISPNETTNHEFRMWIDESATLDNSQNKTIRAKIVISGEPVDEIPVPLNPDNLEAPVLDSKMVAVNIAEDGTITVADENTEYYAYNFSQWANAVIVNNNTYLTAAAGTVIPMTAIEQMYVWIPRYEYKKSSIVNAQESIEINFVPITTVNTDIENNDVIVHPAFTFGGVEQAGLWVGKFENSWDDYFMDDTSGSNNDIETEYYILPNKNSVHLTNVSTMFYNIQDTKTTYSMDATTDVHMMKNTEWGVVAYLSQSQYGICEDDVTCSVKIENNNYYNDWSYDIVTGCGGNDNAQAVDAFGIDICPAENRWETSNGIKASTTHNITGIYDTAGGRYEYVMGNGQDSVGAFNISNSGFTVVLDPKYYDSYVNSAQTTDYTRGLYGDATSELNPTETTMYTWNNDKGYFVISSGSWFVRGGHSNGSFDSGIWNFTYISGSPGNQSTSRSVIVFN